MHERVAIVDDAVGRVRPKRLGRRQRRPGQGLRQHQQPGGPHQCAPAWRCHLSLLRNGRRGECQSSGHVAGGTPLAARSGRACVHVCLVRCTSGVHDGLRHCDHDGDCCRVKRRGGDFSGGTCACPSPLYRPHCNFSDQTIWLVHIRSLFVCSCRISWGNS